MQTRNMHIIHKPNDVTTVVPKQPKQPKHQPIKIPQNKKSQSKLFTQYERNWSNRLGVQVHGTNGMQ